MEMTELGVLLSNVGIELEGDAANPRQAAFQIGIVGHPEVLLRPMIMEHIPFQKHFVHLERVLLSAL